jgi:hypothetical protein
MTPSQSLAAELLPRRMTGVDTALFNSGTKSHDLVPLIFCTSRPTDGDLSWHFCTTILRTASRLPSLQSSNEMLNAGKAVKGNLHPCKPFER